MKLCKIETKKIVLVLKDIMMSKVLNVNNVTNLVKPVTIKKDVPLVLLDLEKLLIKNLGNVFVKNLSTKTLKEFANLVNLNVINV